MINGNYLKKIHQVKRLTFYIDHVTLDFCFMVIFAWLFDLKFSKVSELVSDLKFFLHFHMWEMRPEQTVKGQSTRKLESWAGNYL